MRPLTVVDMFCGAGGISEGLIQAAEALGIQIDLTAINHWERAIETHKLNHPNVRHICQSVESVNPRGLFPRGRIDLLIAAPECVFHSIARGGKPVNDQRRMSAWHVLRWAEVLDIDTILIENVKEFRWWGPLARNNKPIKSRRAETYNIFLAGLRACGYKVEERIINAADHGDATTRERLFILARKRGKLAWPMQSHDKEWKGHRGWRPAEDILDMDFLGESIFHRKKPLTKSTLERIAVGLVKYGGESFLSILQNNNIPKSLRSPCPTITAGGKKIAYCAPKFILGHNTFKSDTVDSLKRPTRTLTSTARDIKLVQGFLVEASHRGGTNRRVHSVNEPVGTIPGSNRFAKVDFMLNQSFKKGNGKYVRSLKDPVYTITSDGQLCKVTSVMVNMKGRSKARSAKDPLVTQTGKFHQYVATVVGTGGATGSRKPRSVKSPLRTIPTSLHQAIAQGFLIPVNHGKKNGRTDKRCYNLSSPAPTLTAKRSLAIIRSFIVKYYRTGTATSVKKPLDTVTAKQRFGLVQSKTNGYVIDIFFRMLTIRELARAMGFPENYQFAGTKEEIVRQIGNAIAVRTARALCKTILLLLTKKAGVA